MLGYLVWMKVKNDPVKLLALYGTTESMRQQVIDRLVELQDYGSLMEVARMDPTRRLGIIETHHPYFPLPQYLQAISLLGSHAFAKKMVMHLHEQYSHEDLRNAAANDKLDSNVRKQLLHMLGEESREKQVVREDYARLRILMEETPFASLVDKDTAHGSDMGAVEIEHLGRYLLNRDELKHDQELAFFKQELTFWSKIEPFNRRFVLAMLAISKLTTRDRVDLVRECRQFELYYPENFHLLTESSELPFDTVRAFFSQKTVNDWLDDYLVSNYVFELINLSRNYKPFAWLHQNLQMIPVRQHIDPGRAFGRYFLTTRFGYQLIEVLPPDENRNRLVESCRVLQENILANLANDSFPLENSLRPLIWIGGADNLGFISRLMNRRIVDNYRRTFEEIEISYSLLKKKIDDPKELGELVRNEIAEKENLIPAEKHRIISSLYFNSLTSVSHPSSQLVKILLANLPTLEQYACLSDEQNRTQLCRFIGVLKLKSHANLLREFMTDPNPQVAIQAAVTLFSLGEKDAESVLGSFVAFPNYLVRKQLAQTLVELGPQVQEGFLLDLARDSHPDVAEAAYRTIAKLPSAQALRLFRSLLPDIYYRSRRDLARILGGMGDVQVIPLLVELVATAETDDYIQIIRALGSIHHRVSQSALKLLELRRNPYLEIERAQALIGLGDTSGWNLLDRYLNYANSPVAQYAKLAFLQQNSGEFLSLIREFTFDPDPMVSVLASGKLFLYKEDEGWESIQRLLHDANAQFLLTYLFHFLPYQRVKGALFTLIQQGDWGVRTVASTVLAENGNAQYLTQLSNALPLTSEPYMQEIVRGLTWLHPPVTIPLLHYIAKHYHGEGIVEVLEILVELEPEETLRFALSMWKKPFEPLQLAIANILGDVINPRILPFINENIADAAPAVKAELAYALLVQGDESGWEWFNQLLASPRSVLNQAAIKRLAKLDRRETFSLLVRHLSTASETLHAEILKAFGMMQLVEAIPLLSKYLMHPSGKLRIAVAKALGEIGSAEARELLQILGKDKDQYVRVAVEIAQQKADRATDWAQPNYEQLFTNVFRSANWRLTETWLRKVYESFADPYSRYAPAPLESLLDHEILEENVLEKRKQNIQNELSAKLIGCTDVEQIVSFKNQAQAQIDHMIPKNLVVCSILAAATAEPDPKLVECLTRFASSGDEAIHTAIILSSAASSSSAWLPVLEAVLENRDAGAYYDPLLFSISRKLGGRALPLLTRLLHYDRARYYLLAFVDFFLLNSDRFSVNDIRESKKALLESKAPGLLLEATQSILNVLLEHKL
jgi:HEAT repeat protein